MPLWCVCVPPKKTCMIFCCVNPRAFGVLTWSFEHAYTHVPTRLLELADYLLHSSSEESPAVPFHCDSCLQRMKEEFPGREGGAVQREMTIVRRETSEELEF